MSDKAPDGPYVYQPFGSLTHPKHEKAGRLWGVGGLPQLAHCSGLTKAEAGRIVEALRSTPAAEQLANWAQQKADEQKFLADDEPAPLDLRRICRANAENFAAIAKLLRGEKL